MKILQTAGFLIIGLFLMMSCAPTSSIVTDYDREADFSQYRTFYWSDEFQMENGGERENEPLFYNTLNEKRLKQAIHREMEGRGYTLSNQNPDLLVNAQIIVEERGTNQNYYPYRGFFYGAAPFPVTETTNKEGDIVVDLIDQNQRQLVWQGYAESVLDIQTAKREDEIREAVTLIFTKYGIRAGQDRPRE